MDRSIKTIWRRTFTYHLKMKPSYIICHANQLIRVYQDGAPKRRRDNHRENGGTLGMVPLIINPIYTLYSGYLLGISPFKGLQQLGYHPKVQYHQFSPWDNDNYPFPSLRFVGTASFHCILPYPESPSRVDSKWRYTSQNMNEQKISRM